jgi:hypothetical protein
LIFMKTCLDLWKEFALQSLPLVRSMTAAACLILTVNVSLSADGPATEQHYLSGREPADAVPWEFEVTGGRRAGERTVIPVPSHWELHGFGTYNYGGEAGRADERGLYKLSFTVPQGWSDRRIRLVFDGVMTDTSVKVNGRSAGPVHSGAFYRFRYDITSLLQTGPGATNLLEVEVGKAASDPLTDRAERGGDYWVFGGIYRSVWLEAVPNRWIEHVAIDARADGSLTADLTLNAREARRPDGPSLVPERIDARIFNADGQPVGELFEKKIPAGGTGRMRISTRINEPRLWTAETPALYTIKLRRMRGDEVLHVVTERFGFRTFEVRDGEGLYLNGQRILLKGVNRHSFRPDAGRALNREDCYDDVRLIRAMNMNAVRMSHYPPDKAFLEACDELGLYVLNELSGWQHGHGTEIGRRLVRELVERDVNHPSILFWDNANEGGWNRDLDGDFALYDPQNRPVLHPWDPFNGIDTRHYSDYNDLARRLRGPNLVMPTEFLHALYDGGGGAGLDDYWRAISESPVGAGAFHWVFADEGIVRSDQDGRIDVFSTFAPDGLVGPRHEKEGSYFTVRDIWSPIQAGAPALDEGFRGSIAVTNRYGFTSLDQCHFEWRLLRFRGPFESGQTRVVMANGSVRAPMIRPHASGELTLPLPTNWREADALELVASNPDKHELRNWVWPTTTLAGRVVSHAKGQVRSVPTVTAASGEIRMTVGETTASFDAHTGLLRSFVRSNKTAILANGPRLVFARPDSAGAVEWLAFAAGDVSDPVRRLAQPHLANALEIELNFGRSIPYGGFKLEISHDGESWKTLYDGTRRSGDGKLYNFPPQIVSAVRITNVRQPDGKPMTVRSVRLGYASARFPAEEGTGTIATGTVNDGNSGETVAWIENRDGAGLNRFRWSMRGDGSLRLDYSYTLDGEFLYHGITFDCPEEQMQSVQWLGEGPYRVWQNRLRGTWLGIHKNSRNEVQHGETWGYPEFQGYFAGLRWAKLETGSGPVTVFSASPELYLRLGTPRIDHQNTTVEFPAGDLSVLHGIPAIGTKFTTPERSGPASHPAKASGTYSGTLVFSLEESQTGTASESLSEK